MTTVWRTALDLLELEGWTTGTVGDKGCGTCAGGAIAFAVAGDRGYLYTPFAADDRTELGAALERFADHVNADRMGYGDIPRDPADRVFSWNDGGMRLVLDEEPYVASFAKNFADVKRALTELDDIDSVK